MLARAVRAVHLAPPMTSSFLNLFRFALIYVSLFNIFERLLLVYVRFVALYFWPFCLYFKNILDAAKNQRQTMSSVENQKSMHIVRSLSMRYSIFKNAYLTYNIIISTEVASKSYQHLTCGKLNENQCINIVLR